MNRKYYQSKFLFATIVTVIYLTFHGNITLAQDHAGLNLKDSLQVKRIADIGRVWGVINYFHPEAGKGKLNIDSLLLQNIAPLISGGSSVDFRTVLNAMLKKLNDRDTKILEVPNTQVQIKHYPLKVTFYKGKLKEGVSYLAVPQQAFKKSFTLDSALNAKELQGPCVIDLRNNEENNQLGIKQYTQFVQPLLASLIHQLMILPTERSFYYKGLMRQDFPSDINILSTVNGKIDGSLQVFYGIRNISQGSYLFPKQSDKIAPGARICFLVNQYTNINSIKAIMALRNRNQCKVIFDGPPPAYLTGDFFGMDVADGIRLKIRTSEVIYEDGTIGKKPDVILGETSSTRNIDPLLLAAQLIKLVEKPQKKTEQENTVYIRKPQDPYSTIGFPNASHRLLGLFNFWNAVQYFSPNKKLIAMDWGNALSYFIPKFINANTENDYFLSLMELTASLKDGHSLLINRKTGVSPNGFFDGNLPIVASPLNGKVFVTSILPDTSQVAVLNKLELGDEIISVDGTNIKDLRSYWERYLVASNDAGFKREYYATWFASGTVGSSSNILISRNGTEHHILLKRIKRNDYYNLRGKVVRKVIIPPLYPPYCKILDGNIGYLRMNRLFVKELDSLANMLKDCKKIIIDARGYPKDGKIGTELAGYIAEKQYTVAYNEFPFITSPDHKKNSIVTDYEVIVPDKNKNLKGKKYFLLVDEGNQSQGEWNIIAIQGVTNATTIGTTTAGTNGMAVTINLPGDYFSFFSGFAEYYLDHTPNQKLGVKIDITVQPTLKGMIEGRDEIMEKALQVIK